MRRKRDHQPTPAELFRTPIVTERLIIREATRSDAAALEQTMDAADLNTGDRTADGARRFGPNLAEVPVWSATRVVCTKGTTRIIGGVVMNEVEVPVGDVRRIGWWLERDAQWLATEVVRAVDERLRAMGADTVIMHLRADDDDALRTAEETGFHRGDAVQHTTSTGERIDFWEYVKAAR